MGFSSVTALDFSTEDFDDLGALYLQVLEDLWNVDSGLNENITELGVDLSRTRLSGSEREAVAYAFGARPRPDGHGDYLRSAGGGGISHPGFSGGTCWRG